MIFDLETLKGLRATLEAARRQSRRDAREASGGVPHWDGVELTMERWARLARGEDPTPPEPADDQEEVFGSMNAGIDEALIYEIAPQARATARPRPSTRGRRRSDEFPELMLAVIFHAFTGKPPTRVWDPYGEREASSFFEFARVSCMAIGLPVRERVL